MRSKVLGTAEPLAACAARGRGAGPPAQVLDLTTGLAVLLAPRLVLVPLYGAPYGATAGSGVGENREETYGYSSSLILEYQYEVADVDAALCMSHC